jgi:hypothetical protein
MTTFGHEDLPALVSEYGQSPLSRRPSDAEVVRVVRGLSNALDVANEMPGHRRLPCGMHLDVAPEPLVVERLAAEQARPGVASMCIHSRRIGRERLRDLLGGNRVVR